MIDRDRRDAEAIRARSALPLGEGIYLKIFQSRSWPMEMHRHCPSLSVIVLLVSLKAALSTAKSERLRSIPTYFCGCNIIVEGVNVAHLVFPYESHPDVLALQLLPGYRFV